MLELVKQQHQRVIDGIATLEERLPFRFALLSRLLDRQMTRVLAPHGMTLGPYRILITISAFGELSPAEITRYVVIDKAQVSRATAELERAGLIEAVRDPKRPRRKWLRLAPAGVEKLAQMEPDTTRRIDGLTAQLDDDELEVLLGAIDKLTRHVAADLERAQPGA